MNFTALAIVSMTVPVLSPAQQACAREVGASSIAVTLSDLPSDIRDEMSRLKPLLGEQLADSDARLLETDAPSLADGGRVNVKFAQAMLVRDMWFVQFEVAMFAGVRTITFRREQHGQFAFVPWQYFGGPACASIKAALAGVTTPPMPN
jgi:hypothetical protein